MEREVLLMRFLRSSFINRTVLLLIILIAFAWYAHAQYTVHASSPKIHFATSNCGTWSVVPNATPNSTYADLFDVTALSANDAWAVGEYFGSSAYQTLTERWDGTQWNFVPSPNVSSDYSFLYAIAAVSTNDAWAVGTYIDDVTYQYYPLIEPLGWEPMEYFP
jgi:hypothetical protein